MNGVYVEVLCLILAVFSLWKPQNLIHTCPSFVSNNDRQTLKIKDIKDDEEEILQFRSVEMNKKTVATQAYYLKKEKLLKG